MLDCSEWRLQCSYTNITVTDGNVIGEPVMTCTNLKYCCKWRLQYIDTSVSVDHGVVVAEPAMTGTKLIY